MVTAMEADGEEFRDSDVILVISCKTMLLIYIFSVSVTAYLLRYWFSRKRLLWKKNNPCKITVGFFHPYCNAGGGGERVLWAAIRAVQTRYSDAQCVVYTGDSASEEDILKRVQIRFNITFERDIKFVFLKGRVLVEAKMYPFFTLLLQNLGSLFLGFEALFNFVPDIYIDTMGYAFTLLVFKAIGTCSTGCYVHYPTISTDMLCAVSERKVAVNNRRFISNSPLLSFLKIYYYKAFSLLYGYMGRRADVVMVNSSWTKGHIMSLWKCPSKTFLVYPPCDVTEFASFPLPAPKENHRILSIAQFRPEKDHELQIKSFHRLLTNLPDDNPLKLKLVLVGSCRDTEDETLVEKLKKLCNRLEISENVEFKLNLPFSELISEMKNASIALHTMWNEHFGIGVVECMASGLVVIAHDSGGPKMDIVVDYDGMKTGFLASDVDSFANAMDLVLKMPVEEQTKIRINARRSAERFSVEKFEKSFLDATEELFL